MSVDVNTPQDNILYLSTALVIMDGEGSPEGVVNAALGSLYCDKLTGNYYKKGSAIGTLTGWASFGGGGGGGSIGGSIASTQVAVGSAANTIAGYASLIYDEPNALFYLTQSINAAASLASINTNAGTSAIAQVTANANSVQSTLFSTSSGYIPVGLFGANYSVLNLASTTAALIRAGSGAPLIFGIGSTEYARLTTIRLGLLSLGLGASPSSLDVLLERDGANELALRNSTTPQTFRIYSTYTNSSNYERLSCNYAGGLFSILVEKAGTGGNRSLQIGTGAGVGASLAFLVSGSERWAIDTSGHFIAGLDNTYDIGASGATRPRTGYFGTSVFSPVIYATTNLVAQNRLSLTSSGSVKMYSNGEGIAVITNNVETDFIRLSLGGTTTSYPAIGRSGASIVLQLADGTLQTPILPVNTNQLQLGGADAASPGAISLRVQNVLTGTSNTDGQNFSIFGSRSTGNGVGGSILLRTSPAGSIGTSQNSTIVTWAATGDGRVYGTALHNNSAGLDSGPTIQHLGSATYSPTITAVANCTVTTPGVNFKYLRVGNVVHVTGQLSVDPTTASTLTRVRIALPIVSNLTGTVGCQGTGNCGDVFGLGGAIFPDTTNNEAELNFICESGTPANNVWCVSFSYEVA